jgi:hypothetical protein
LVGLWIAAAGCGSSSPPDNVDAGTDAAPDGPPACTPTVLLTGGADPAAQGWTVVMQPPAAMTYVADYTRIETTTNVNARTGGQFLLTYANAAEVGKPFQLQFELMVESVSPRNLLDAGAAILASFTPPFGDSVERAQMIFLDSAAVGWSDNSASFPTAVTNGAYHTYVFSVDAASVARLTIDGTAALMRTNFAFNGRIAVGDQTNDSNVDGAMRIRKITKLCP